MKKTLDVNISGFIYHIDQDAYDKLLNYINKLEKHYGDNEEAKEIVRDIEQRISELLNERKLSENIVFSIKDIEEIISILGTPEELFEEEENSFDNKTEDSSSKQKVRRRLYRSRTHRIFAGVAYGVASYLGLPVILIRALLIIFYMVGYGFPFLLYIILWITVPEARTPSQKLEMKGEAINVDNIEKTIKKEYENVKNDINKKSPKLKTFLDRLGNLLYEIIHFIGKFARSIIGVLFATLGLIVIISFIGSLFLAGSIFLPFDDIYLMNVIPEVLLNSTSLNIFYISFTLLICIPFFLITYLGIKMLFRIKSSSSIVGFSCLALWIFSIISLAIIGGSQLKNFKESADTYTVAENLESTSNNVLYINNRDNAVVHDEDDIMIKDIYLTTKDNYTLLYGKPKIRFEKSETSNYGLIIKRHASSKTKKNAFNSAENIQLKWNLQDSILHIDRFFKIDNEIKWKNQQVTISIKVPVGKDIVIDQYTYEYADIDNENFSDFYKNFKSKSSWRMSEDGILVNTESIED